MKPLAAIAILGCLVLGGGCGNEPPPPDDKPEEAVRVEPPVLEIAQRFHGHEGAITDLAFLSNDLLASISADDSTLRFWAMRDGRPLRVIQTANRPRDLVVLPQGSGVMVADEKGQVTVWKIRDGKIGSGRTLLRNAAGQLALSPDGKHLAVAGTEQPLAIHDLPSGVRLRNMTGSSWVRRVDFGISSDLLIGAGDEGQVGLWSISDEQSQTFDLEVEEGAAAVALDYGPDGRRVALVYTDGSVILADLLSREKQIHRARV
ncbi:MAG: hypothetical protein R3236_06545, partial [Phycisphaeraceae bacterium]|nr:hypothetical protein [Phycisphaeraceae bacterium]